MSHAMYSLDLADTLVVQRIVKKILIIVIHSY